MSDLLRVACVQMTSGPEKAANLEKGERLVARAASTGSDVVVLPEKWNAIGEADALHAAAEPLEGGETVEAMAGWARAHGITLVGGSIAELRDGHEKLSNTSIAFHFSGSTTTSAPVDAARATSFSAFSRLRPFSGPLVIWTQATRKRSAIGAG